jgi:hypothetical protein
MATVSARVQPMADGVQPMAEVVPTVGWTHDGLDVGGSSAPSISTTLTMAYAAMEARQSCRLDRLETEDSYEILPTAHIDYCSFPMI